MKKKKGKKRKSNPKDYESYSYGPFKLERSGRFVRMSSNWAEGEHEKYMAKVKELRPNLKKDIDEKIEKMISLINQYDPLEFLTVIATRNCFVDPEEYTESTHEGRECFVEFALSLVLSQKRKSGTPHAPKEAIDEFMKLVSEIMNNVLWYFGSEVAEGKRSKIEEEIRFTMIGWYLYVRGDSYQEHHVEMIREIFSPHNDFFKQHYALECDKLISALQHISDQPAINLREQAEVMLLMKEMHELFKKFADEKGADTFTSIEDMKKQYFSSPDVQEKKVEFDKKSHLLNNNPFEIVPSEHIPKEVLDLLCSEFGDNGSFLEVPGFKAWPTNDSIINTQPLIKEDGKYYCFLPQMVFRQIGDILEELILQKSKKYYKNTYLKKQSHNLEGKTLEYLAKLMPGAEVYPNLYYNIEENGVRKRPETDGLILFDENLFIVEAKSGRLSVSSRRGGLIRLKDELNSIMGKAFNQALRTKNYIESKTTPVFENEDGVEVLRIENKARFENIYLINSTLQNLNTLAAHIPTLKNWGYVKGTEWPWSVFINDLRVISEILDSPTLFLLYLQRRIKANDYPQFHAHDELDFLMVYLKEGLFFEDGYLGDVSKYSPHGYTEDLDRYYDFKAGRVSSGEKPRMLIEPEYEVLIKEIESSGKLGFTIASTTLLGFDIPTRKAVLEHIEKFRALAASDGKDHDITMYFNSSKMGFMCSISYNRKPDFWDRMDKHCRLKLYQTKFEEWVLITIDYDTNGNRSFDFRLYKKKWQYDEEMERQLKKFKEWKLEQFKKTGQEIGRNDTCPCGSGLKYKKCCGK